MDVITDLPSVPEITAVLPSVPVLTVSVPEIPIVYLPDGFIPPFIPETTAEATGEGTATVTPIVVVAVLGLGDGAARLTPAGRTDAAALGSGTASVAAGALWAAAALASGSGTSVARAAGLARIVAAGAGAAAVRAVPRPVINAAGAGTAAVRPVVVVAIEAQGSGSVIVSAYELGAAFPTTIEASGRGEAFVDGMAIYSTTLIAFGTGQLTVAAAPVVSGAASGAGTAVVAPRGAVRAAASGAGTAVVRSIARTSALASGAGTAIVTPRTLSPMGMLKSGSQSPDIGGSTWTDLTSFTVDPAYPETVLSGGNKLVANGSGQANFAASVGWTGQTGTYTRDIRVLINGAAVWSQGPQSQGAGSVSTGSFSAPLALGDTVTLQAWTDSLSSRRGVVAANTFLRYTLV